MKFAGAATIALAAMPHVTLAHYFFPHLYVNDVKSEEFEYVRRSTQGFQPHFGFDILSSDDMRCNTGAQANAGSTKLASINAGDTIGFGTNLDGNIQHPGPIQVYMSRATGDDVASYDGSGDWFKVYELGANFPMESSGENWQVWGKNRIDFQVPTEVPSGQYLVRIEHLALHRPSGTEFYFNCAHVEVTNTGSALEPSDLVKIPGVYDSTTEGLSPNYSIYSGGTSYPMPGPAIFPTGSEQSATDGSSTTPVNTTPGSTPTALAAEDTGSAGCKSVPKFSRRYYRGN
ncbi:glycosyl hydrolase family 61-domain-containing protein [Thelonectria olida]|uniref:lytic cellulose monooxygenase (C4-dehydrogenating) n=1 Tax=Thelonectria olida TaxID=1576542 RepID=A0A9P8W2C5_9HYPO|nr:glycosyl hydrolase family 61-domain-containing protein [Thelonectria olida]